MLPRGTVPFFIRRLRGHTRLSLISGDYTALCRRAGHEMKKPGFTGNRVSERVGRIGRDIATAALKHVEDEMVSAVVRMRVRIKIVPPGIIDRNLSFLRITIVQVVVLYRSAVVVRVIDVRVVVIASPI